MNLRELRAAHPDLFYPQTWFDGEQFMEREAQPMPSVPEFQQSYLPDWGVRFIPFAAVLAATYVKDPEASIWTRYLWTADTDHLGQCVYVGCNGKGLEIHRHLHITERWGVAVWL